MRNGSRLAALIAGLLSAPYPEIRDRLLERSAAWLSREVEPIEELELSSEEVEKLRALGYVD